jgi:N-acetylglucosaminyldiphosphoundecaprenol N-acetyl-beta-D-mannosaminyltransferase
MTFINMPRPQVPAILATGHGMAIPEFRVLGVRVSAVQIPDVVGLMEQWIERRETGRYVTVTGMHGVSEAQENVEFKRILNRADLVVPDGMPLVWLGRYRGYLLKRRVYGPELMMTFCETTSHKGYRHFLYGGAKGVPEQLADVLSAKYPQIKIVGTYSPPFRFLNPAEEAMLVERVKSASPDVLWVGLSTPKQERWMDQFKDKLQVPVMVGVGAAFDFHTGRVQQAPAWMRENGLEWLFRLIREPRRLWRRYLVRGSDFVYNVGLELLNLKSFEL